MREINRQVVIFGDFKSIGFDIITKLTEIIDKYKFNIEAMPDYIQQKGPAGIKLNELNMLIPQIISQENMRPSLKNRENNLAVFIGTNRIHIEQNNSTTETYDNFISTSLEILEKIISDNDKLIINRLALNGNLILDDIEKIDAIYANTFKQSPLYGDSSDEFSFRINTKEMSQELNIPTNKIISFERTNEILQNQTTKPVVLINYDYNTSINEECVLTLNHLNILIDLTKNYKSLI